MKQEGESNQWHCEGVTDRVAEQRVWDNVIERNHKTNKMRIKYGFLQHLQISKKIPTRHHYREIPRSISRNLTC